MLPFRPVDGSIPDTNDIQTAVGQAIFHLLTGGDLKQDEKKAYRELINNTTPFFPDWINFLIGGGAKLRKVAKGYVTIRDAITRYPQAPALQRAVQLGKDYGWTPGETTRFLTMVFGVAGAAGPTLLATRVLERLYENPQLIAEYEQNKFAFIREQARLTQAVPFINMFSYDPTMTVEVGGKAIMVPKNTPIHAGIGSANRDSSVFGANAQEFDASREQLGQILTWSGTEDKFSDQRKPHRGCPGHDLSLMIVSFIVDHYKPMDTNNEVIAASRYTQVFRDGLQPIIQLIVQAGRKKQTNFNANHPDTADVLHPLDSEDTNDLGAEPLPWGDEMHFC